MWVNAAKFVWSCRKVALLLGLLDSWPLCTKVGSVLLVYSPSTPEPGPFLSTSIPGRGSVRLQISRLEIGTCSAVVPECWSASQCPWMGHKYCSLHMCGIVHVATSQSTGLIKGNELRTPLHNTAIRASSIECKTSRTHKVASFLYCGCLLF